MRHQETGKKLHPAVERLPLYKALDSGRRTNEVVVELDYRPASPSEIIEAARNLEGAEEIWNCTGFGGFVCGPSDRASARNHPRCGWRLVIPFEDPA